MLKKMRQRVIIAAMLAFFAVIFMIAVLVNVVNFCVVTNNADRTLSAILSYEEGPPGKPERKGPPPEPFMALPDVEANFMTRFFVVRFNEAGEVVYSSTENIASVGEEEAAELAEKVFNGRSDHGYMKEYRYIRAESGDTTTVIFLNIIRDQQSVRSLLILTVIVSLVSLVIVFILVTLFSGKAIRPIARNIEQQKQFITDAGHELKTPLTSISTSLDVITMEHGEDEWTDNIRKQTGRMSKLVSELVTLSRLDEEIPLPDKETFSLSNAAWEITEIYSPQAKADDKKFTAEITDDIYMNGDKAAIQQMLSVLLDNAVKYSGPNGEIRFGVFKKRGKINIEVFNTCRYDVPPDVNRLFDRFYRPDGSRSTETGGTGVGLAIAKAVADAHGGTISASCPSGKTMTIRISL